MIRWHDDLLDRLLDRHVRLAVTGLSRSGKTVFTTSLVHLLRHLRQEKHLGHLGIEAIEGVEVRGSPSLEAPLFPYERVIESLGAAMPTWPEGTRTVSEIRVAIRYRPQRSLFGPRLRTLFVDIVDYPGEWLLDLPLMHLGYAQWSERTIALCREEPRFARARDWLAYADALEPAAPADPQAITEGARRYRDFLVACRDGRPALQFLQPGRLLMPGELEGAPMLELFPLPYPEGGADTGSFWAELERRFEAYKTHVVQGFYERHFARFDRQVVLVDLLSVLNSGDAAYHDTRIALESVLDNFRYGREAWWSRLFRSRIDRLLFAVTKADRVSRAQSPLLRELLTRMLAESENDIAFNGVTVKTLALSALCCTEDVPCRVEGRPVTCIRGIPVDEGPDAAPRVRFPGQVPHEPPLPGDWDGYEFIDFAPPRLRDVRSAALPQLKMLEVVHFLLGDHFA